MFAKCEKEFQPAGAAMRPAPHVDSGGSRYVSQESVDVGGWQSGRHRPNALASLSARIGRWLLAGSCMYGTWWAKGVRAVMDRTVFLGRFGLAQGGSGLEQCS
jgi:hypothetical protein